MRVVLYTEDMEAITVLELPQVAVDHLHLHRRVLVPVLESALVMFAPGDKPTRQAPKVVEIYAEQFRRNGVEHMMLFTRHEEAALMLRSELLPGQRRDSQEQAREQFARGFLAGLQVAMRG